jgi:hypothetical protein
LASRANFVHCAWCCGKLAANSVSQLMEELT